MKQSATLYSAQQGHAVWSGLWPEIKASLMAGQKLQVSVTDEGRNLEQNAAQWPILDAFSAQLQWPVNAELVYMSADEWKDVLTAAFNREAVRIAKGLDGGVVMLGLRTSRFTKKRFSEWLDFLNATAAQRGVRIETERETT